MSLGELPAVILDVVVACAGEEHGWRLEVVSSSLQATSMECAAVRLGKCRWMGGNRAEFRPSWRHVAVALRRGPYYLLRPSGNLYGYKHTRFGGVSTVIGVRRPAADKFTIEPTMNGEGIIERIDAHGRSLVSCWEHHPEGASINLYYAPEYRSRWLLHLGSHASHLPFRRCRTATGVHRVLRALGGDNWEEYSVTNWELAPATLADDERFEWRV